MGHLPVLLVERPSKRVGSALKGGGEKAVESGGEVVELEESREGGIKRENKEGAGEDGFAVMEVDISECDVCLVSIAKSILVTSSVALGKLELRVRPDERDVSDSRDSMP